VANHKSALKRAKQNEKRYARNKAYRTRLKNILKSARLTIEQEENPEVVEQQLKKAERLIYKIETKGIIHKNKAARLVSRLYKKAHTKAS